REMRLVRQGSRVAQDLFDAARVAVEAVDGAADDIVHLDAEGLADLVREAAQGSQGPLVGVNEGERRVREEDVRLDVGQAGSHKRERVQLAVAARLGFLHRALLGGSAHRRGSGSCRWLFVIRTETLRLGTSGQNPKGGQCPPYKGLIL